MHYAKLFVFHSTDHYPSDGEEVTVSQRNQKNGPPMHLKLPKLRNTLIHMVLVIKLWKIWKEILTLQLKKVFLWWLPMDLINSLSILMRSQSTNGLVVQKMVLFQECTSNLWMAKHMNLSIVLDAAIKANFFHKQCFQKKEYGVLCQLPWLFQKILWGCRCKNDQKKKKRKMQNLFTLLL